MRRRILLAFCLTATTAAANDFSPRAIISWENRDSGAASTSYLREELELSMTRMLSDAISVRLKLGANHYDSESTRVFETRPSGTITIALGPVSAEGEYALRTSSFDAANSDHKTANEIVRLQSEWRPVRFLPGGQLRATRYRLEDDRFGEGLTNDAIYALLTKSWNGFTVAGGGNLRLDRDERVGFERTTHERLASLAYTDAWLDSRVVFSAAASGMLTDIEDSAGERTTRIPTYLPVARAFWGVDETPLDTLDNPFVSFPTLIDNRFDVLTSITLGPEAASFQTIAFDLGAISQVDQIEIVVRDERRDPVLVAAGVLWDVYTSIDGERWTPHTDGLVTTFNVPRSQYEISFDRVDVRWIKVVSFGVAAQPVFVTEARALFFTQLTFNTRDSEYENLSATTSLTVMPHRHFRIHYAGTGWYLSQRLGIEPATETRDLNHQLSAHYDPHPRAGFDARVQFRDATTGRYSEDTNAYSLGARLTPLRRLQLSLFCERRDDDFAKGLVEGRLCSGSASAQIFPTLDVIFGASDRHEEHVDSGGTLSTRSYQAAATARLTPSLRFTLNGTSTQTESAGDFTTIPPPSRDERINADFDLRVGRALGLGVTVGWVAGEERSGMTQRYRVRWNPFGDGAITLTTSYNQDIDPYSDSRSRRLFVSPRWQINNVTALTIGYSSVFLEGQQSFQSESILASLSFFR